MEVVVHLEMARRTEEKRVTFGSVETNVIDNCIGGQVICTKDQWYSREELVTSCTQAKNMVKTINGMKQTGAIDHSQICVVGLEKQFHGKKERDKYRRLLVKSVLIRQEMNKNLGLEHDTRSLCEISEMISASFKEFALWQAAMHKFHAHDGNEDPTTKSSSSSCNNVNNMRSSVHTVAQPAAQLHQSHHARHQYIQNHHQQQQQPQPQHQPNHQHYHPHPHLEAQVAKRQKTASASDEGGYSDAQTSVAGLQQEDLDVIEKSKGLTRKDSELLLSEMQHFVEGYCSR